MIDPVVFKAHSGQDKTGKRKERLPASVAEADLDAIKISAANDFPIAPAGP